MRLTHDQARSRFAASPVAVLGTSDDTGAAHLVPVTFLAAGDTVYIAIDDKPKSSRDLKRLRNIAADPRVCLLAQHYDEDWNRLWWARADGIARVVGAVELPFGVLGGLAERYPWYRAHPPGGPLIEVAVRSWSGWAFAESPPALGV